MGWVPFLMKAGKALHTRSAEIRVQFRHVPGNLYKRSFGTDLYQATNELVFRVQPDEALYLKINNKVPGLGMRLDRSNLNLHYSKIFQRDSRCLREFYPYGSRGPVGTHYLAAKYNVRWGDISSEDQEG